MQTRDAVEAMMVIMKNEETFGRPDIPVGVEAPPSARRCRFVRGRSGGGCGYGSGWDGRGVCARKWWPARGRARARRRRRLPPRRPQALLQCVGQLTISGEIAGRMLTRMAEVLEGRHTDAEIAEADVTVWRDFAQETVEQQKRRVSQHSLFVQVDGTGELMRYLLLHIPLSPTAYAPTGVGARVLNWARERQREKDMHMMGLAEQTMDLPDIKLEGYEYLFTESLHRIPELATEGHEQADAGRSQAELDKSTGESISVAAAFRTLLALLRLARTPRSVRCLRSCATRRSCARSSASPPRLRRSAGTRRTQALTCCSSCRTSASCRRRHCTRCEVAGWGEEGREEVTGGRRWRRRGEGGGGGEEEGVGRRRWGGGRDRAGCHPSRPTPPQEPEMLHLYDMICIMLRSCLALVEPRVHAVISQARPAPDSAPRSGFV